MLARQGLLARQPLDADAMIAHLIGLQGQLHNAPHVGLWSRLVHYRAADLEALLDSRAVVRASAQRLTLHVMASEDFLGIRPLLDGAAERLFRSNPRKALGDADVDAIRAASRVLLDAEALTAQQLGERLALRWPGLDPIALSMPARVLEPLVHVPPAGFWGTTGAPRLAGAGRWLGREPGPPMPIEGLVRRYLAAYGPASGADFSAWSGLTGGAALLAGLGDALLRFTGADGRLLFDLPDAARPPPEMPAPARLLGDYDGALLGYAQRTRLLAPEFAPLLARPNGMRAAFLVDGMVRGSWALRRDGGTARIEATCFGPLDARERRALAGEAEALLADLMPGITAEVVFQLVGSG